MNHNSVELRVSDGLTPYPEAVAFMERRAGDIRSGRAPQTVWLVEHPPLYTAGTSAGPGELLEPERFPVFKAGRGGRYTYHGPGQRVAYVMIDLKRRGGDVRAFVRSLEEWAILTLALFGVRGERRDDRIGVWVEKEKGAEGKIAAVGVRVRRWVTFHGLAVNVDPDLSHFSGIVPCGISEYGVTSLRQLGVDCSLADVDDALAATFAEVFGMPIV
ncbi:MAG: lipoate-protein ligase B [Rhodospirillales bacterium RIFCSPLOWO2_12_FULL_58_28]|nr:MAG: lipoate-protein ligase B [Rhodospirillales bacterium RIFCSPLOWO2_02_FULL_58_16]OHC77773.1 MAG: lipoate-protein ligase B [Rhodospirillales bacterium RIFCSPLOWO2_12_FULL_58_28]